MAKGSRGGRSTMRSIVKSGAILAALAMTWAAQSVEAQYPSLDTACTRHYTVVAGDTCDIIGQKTQTSTYQILANNLPESGPNCYTLEIGHQLCLGRYGNDCQLVHRVIGSDSCESVAAKYDISTDLLNLNNPNLNCNNLYDGFVLCVAPGLIRPPADPSLNVSYVASQPPSAINVVMPPGQVIHAAIKPNTTSATAGKNNTAKADTKAPKPEQAKIPTHHRHGHLRHGKHGHHH